MKPNGFAVVDGAVRHAHGVLAATTSGQERRELHLKLMLASEALIRKPRSTEAAARALDVFRRDPSLLLETIPNRYPLERVSAEGYVNADAVWNNISTWYGSWAGRFHAQSCFPVVEFALRAGVHPDDKAIWGGSPLLADDEFQANAENVELALRHGASPDPSDDVPGNSYLKRFLSQIEDLVDGSPATPRDADALRDAIRRANLLLDAGPTRIDFDPEELSQQSGGTAARALKSPIGMLTDAQGLLNYAEDGLDKEVYSLMGKMYRAGADINRPNGVLGLPPVLQCIYALHIEGACELIRLGCRTDVEAIPRPGRGALKTLEVLATEAGGDEFRTRILAAQIERDIARKAKPAPESTPLPQAPRRRMGAV